MSTDWFFAYPWLVLPGLFICYGLFVVIVGRWLSRLSVYDKDPDVVSVEEHRRMLHDLGRRG